MVSCTLGWGKTGVTGDFVSSFMDNIKGDLTVRLFPFPGSDGEDPKWWVYLKKVFDQIPHISIPIFS